MTDNDIIKALEYCSKQGITSECERCKVKKGCRAELIAKALDLIKRQKAEIERLQKECGNQSTLWSKHFESIFETAKETIKAEAVREFAEKIYEMTWYHINSQGKLVKGANSETNIPLYKAEDINNILKEMVGEE